MLFSGNGTRAQSDGENPERIGRLLMDALGVQFAELLELIRELRRKIKPGLVHDVRVCIRRLTALLDLMRATVHVPSVAALRKKVRTIQNEMGQVRDVQVQVRLIGELLETLPELDNYHKSLERRETKRKRKARQALEGVRVKRLKKLEEAVRLDVAPHWSEHLSARQRVQALEAVDKAFAVVVEARQQLDVTRLDTVHRMRIEFKKFRYMVEVMQPLLPRVGAAQINSMHAFQSMMGDVHDMDVLTAELARYRQKRKKPERLGAAQDELAHRLLMMADGFMTASDELFTFWDHSWIPEGLPPN